MSTYSSRTACSRPAAALGGAPVAVGIAILASGIGSLSYLVNRIMSLDGGSWVWNASLRYIYLVPMIAILLTMRAPREAPVRDLLTIFVRRPLRWMLIGTCGAGAFYGGICYGISVSPSWIVAATWQTTIVFSLVILSLQGYRITKVAALCVAVVFVSAVAINVDTAIGSPSTKQILIGVGVILAAAVAYPFANQMIYRDIRALEAAKSPYAKVLRNPLGCVFLISLGSMPFFITLIFVFRPGVPHPEQLLAIFLVAITSGLVSTSLFLLARNMATDGRTLAAVDATQSFQVVFSLALEMIVLDRGWPTLLQGTLVLAIIAGVAILAFSRTATS